MKTTKLKIGLIISISLLVITCQKKDYKLDEPLDKSQLQFEVTQDLNADAGGNTVILVNKTPETVAIWDYGTGKSTRQQDTVHFAFKGDYVIRFSAMTGGGIVEADSVIISVTDNNLNYVNDPLWLALSGGPNNERTWILDIDQHFFDGPMFFYGTDNGWLAGGDSGCYGEDCWNWSPDYPGNTWLMPYGDYGSMTFNLKNGPNVIVNHLMIPGKSTETGTYSLNINDKTLTLNNASILHDNDRDACVGNWGSIKLFALTETTMQLGVLRKASCEGEAYLVYNFVSKDFAESQTAE